MPLEIIDIIYLENLKKKLMKSRTLKESKKNEGILAEMD